jgi:hypothetical protein
MAAMQLVPGGVATFAGYISILAIKWRGEHNPARNLESTVLDLV